jgi:hypothetical protein
VAEIVLPIRRDIGVFAALGLWARQSARFYGKQAEEETMLELMTVQEQINKAAAEGAQQIKLPELNACKLPPASYCKWANGSYMLLSANEMR